VQEREEKEKKEESFLGEEWFGTFFPDGGGSGVITRFGQDNGVAIRA
jgi:hypothetical protein